MAKKDNLKLTILVNGNPVYFGAPVFYNSKDDGDGTTLFITTEIGTTTKQKIEIQLKNPTYVESTDIPKSGESARSDNNASGGSESQKI